MAFYMILLALLVLQLLNSVNSGCTYLKSYQDLFANSKCYSAFQDVRSEIPNSDACSGECTRLVVNYVDQCSPVSKLCNCS